MRGGGWVVLLCGFLTAPCVAGAPGAEGAAAARSALPGLEQMVASPRDLWGEAAMREPNGASYEFFEKLLPPPRYVNADFRYYPIVLSGPGASVKARLVSNGSGVNLRGGARSWNDVGTPLVFRVGPDEFCFGAVPDRLSHPTLAEGYLPIVEIRYQHASPVQAEGSIPLRQTQVDRVPEVYCLEAFASTDPALADNAMVFVRFSLVQGARGVVAVQADAKSPVTFARGKMTDEQGRVLACFDGRWHWERQRAVAALVPGVQATLAIATKPLEGAASLELAPDAYERHRKACAATWQQILDSGMSLDCPEPRVNDAWRNLIVQDFSLLHGDRIHYSAGNQYDKLYEAEGSDAALAMMLWGYEDEMRRMIVPLLDFTRKGLEFHQAGLKINDVCRLYWQTRDAGLVESLRPRWEKELRRILEGRTRPHGLLPKEQYCGDVRTPVHSLSANAKAWRAVRDLGAVLADLGRGEEAERLARAAAEYHRDILAALKQSVRRDTVPPFVPIALLDDEPAHDPITATRIGSYWNLVINYVVGSGIFGPGSEEERWIPRYLQEHGGLCMGMTRSGGTAHAFWTGPHRVNPLYGTRYVIDVLRRDEPERALVSFYGMLAQGMTRNTFLGGEGCCLSALDGGGRFFYCPPNSASNGHFLSMLRHLLVQDFDLDDDGRPETLRLLAATPRRWLEEGKTLRLERAPTAFGPLALSVRSRLAAGEVVADLDLPGRNRPQSTLLRMRVPEGWRVVSAQAGQQTIRADDQGTVDISSLQGRQTIRFQVVRGGPKGDVR